MTTSIRPSKKATVDSLRDDLDRLGLDTNGKKETLLKRLTNFFKARTLQSPLLTNQTSTPESAHESDQKQLVSSHSPEQLFPVPFNSNDRDVQATIASSTTPTSTATQVSAPRQPYRSFLCFDVEATCEPGVNFDYPNEIIEFPVVLLQWVEDQSEDPITNRRSKSLRLNKVDSFHSYVRPTLNPKLSEFCTALTGITQDMVDNAPTFPQVLTKLEEWMDGWKLREGDRLKDAMWVTDGPWDLRDFIPKQLFITPPTPPRYPAYLLAPYLNIKQAVALILFETHKRETKSLPTSSAKNWPRLTTGKTISHAAKEAMRSSAAGNGGGSYWLNIAGQLEALGLGAFQGKQHSGIDDATNVGRILCELANRNILIEPNSRLPPAKNAKTWAWMGEDGCVIWPLPDFNKTTDGTRTITPSKPKSNIADTASGESSNCSTSVSTTLDGQDSATPTPSPVKLSKNQKRKARRAASNAVV